MRSYGSQIETGLFWTESISRFVNIAIGRRPVHCAASTYDFQGIFYVLDSFHQVSRIRQEPHWESQDFSYY